MINQKDKDRFRKHLHERRDEIFRLREELMESQQILSEPEIEPGEKAEKESIARTADLLEDREKQEIEDIDWALRKLETGSFGTCESCGKEIAPKRLEAIPWIRLCKQCASLKT